MFGFEKKIPEVTVDEVMRSLDTNESVVLLDVRTPGEYEKGKIAGSINVPVQDIASDVWKVVPEKGQKIYVYCLSGSRSNIAVEEMLKLGYTNVYSVKSGMLAWRIRNFPTV
ncbi:MAG TPA: rhodanese-like domain-containing protein [Patescibacteria group bacterium]|nr:rhodanese-like domain-containing protein [Patescibacteria group bacterium]